MRGEKPIIALANVQACSGAYWLASAADEVVVTPSGRLGSIGVFILHLDETGWEANEGLKSTYIAAGRYKVEGNSSEPLSEEAEQHIREIVDDYYALFVDGVAAGRGVSADSVKDGFGEGLVVTAQRAVELGMADRVDSFEGVVSKLAGTESGTGRLQTRSLRVIDPASSPQASTEKQHEDKPDSKASADEDRARISALATAQPHHHH
jgi:ClpP class serine protease